MRIRPFILICAQQIESARCCCAWWAWLEDNRCVESGRGEDAEKESEVRSGAGVRRIIHARTPQSVVVASGFLGRRVNSTASLHLL